MAMQFNGVDEYWISAANSAALNAATAFSISFWYFQDVSITAGTRCMVSRQVGAINDDFFFVGVFGGTDNNLQARCDRGGGVGLAASGGLNSSLPVQTWQHVVAIYNQTGGSTTVRLYKNAVLLAQNSGAGTIDPSNNPIMIGANMDTATLVSFWDGGLEDVRIYTRVLGDSDIGTIYTAKGKDGIVDNLIARWQFNEQGPGISPAQVPDLTGRNEMQLVTKGGAPSYTSGITVRRMRQIKGLRPRLGP